MSLIPIVITLNILLLNFKKEIRIDKQQLIFEASCQVPVLDKAIIGRGSSHRKAEQKTAERVLILIGDGSRS